MKFGSINVKQVEVAAALGAVPCLVILAVAISVEGCGGQQGITNGASSQTSVVIKHEKAEPESGGAPKAAAEQGGGAPAAAGGFGTLKGKVVFQGTAPVLADLIKQGQKVPDPICSAKPIPDEKLVVDSSGGVANVVIFLPKAPAGVAVPPPPSEPVGFDNKGCHFIPHVLLVRVGQPVKILNDDFPLNHNTHTYAQRNNNFNSTIPKAGTDFKYTKPENEPCEVKCDIHAWMKAYHFPLDHPYVAVSGPNGEFEIKNVPAGTHSFRVWQEAAAGHFLNRNLPVTIKPGETTTIEIKYDAANFAG